MNFRKNQRLLPAKTKNKFFTAFVLMFSVLSLAQACASQKQTLTITRSDGGSVSVSAELAKTEEQQTQGLMNRKSLADGEGMLFVYNADTIMHFWMKNTLIDLSIAFIASDGRILEIRNMRKGDLTITTSSRSARYALEVPQGWFGRAGITSGDRLVIEKW
jgi:uncharacterized membrane protein (UPF0127 family)